MINPFNLFRFVPLSCLRILAQIVAWVMNQMTTLKVHKTISSNLHLTYPNLERSKRAYLHQQIIKNQALNSVESIKSWAMPPAWSIAQIHSVHNEELFQNALNNPKGMLAIVPHLGTWEMMNAWLNQFGSPTIMYKPIKGKLVNDFILQGRQKLNATLVPTDATGVKAVFKTLKSGGFSIILPDHSPSPSGGVMAPFFGIPTLTSTLASKLAQKTGCALVGLTCVRRNDSKFDIVCYKLDDPNLYHKDIAVAAYALNLAMQKMIDPICTHYIWSYRRFKHVPNVDDIYSLSDDKLNELACLYHNNLANE